MRYDVYLERVGYDEVVVEADTEADAMRLAEKENIGWHATSAEKWLTIDERMARLAELAEELRALRSGEGE